MRETGTELTSKALFITSDNDVAVYAVNREKYSADAFLALPIDVLGKEYYTGDCYSIILSPYSFFFCSLFYSLFIFIKLQL